MHVELFLRSIDQEFGANSLKGGNTNRIANADWRAWDNWNNWDNWDNWTNWENWNNWNNYSAATEPSVALGIEKMRIRREDFGGLAFDPASRQVLKVDQEGFEALLLLQQEKSYKAICSTLGVDSDTLCKFLERVGHYLGRRNG